MNRLLLDYIQKYERDLTRALHPPRSAPLTGTLGALRGEEAERRIQECLTAILPRSVEVAAKQVIFDGRNRRTAQAVDLVLLGSTGVRFQLEGRPFVAVDGVRAAVEVKASYSRSALRSALGQLVQVKKLSRARSRKVELGDTAPPPRGNVFCGALFVGATERLPSGRGWRTFVERVCRETRALWKTLPGKRLCDSGRYPNFFWFWNTAFVLKRYARGDWGVHPAGAARPVFESAPFRAPSTAEGRGMDDVYYQVWQARRRGAQRLSPLALAAHRLVLQATEFRREEVDWGEYFFGG